MRDKDKLPDGEQDQSSDRDEDDQQLSLTIEEPPTLESIIVYDENRNLSLDPSAEKQNKLEEQQVDLTRQRDETSPVLSLATSDEANDLSQATGCSGTTNARTSSTRHVSCSSLTLNLKLNSEEVEAKYRNELELRRKLKRRRQAQGRGDLDDEEEDDTSEIMVRMLDNYGEHDAARMPIARIIHEYPGGRNGNSSSTNSLVRQLGRRMSELPQFLARRLSINRLAGNPATTANEAINNYRRAHRQQHHDIRRYSMQDGLARADEQNGQPTSYLPMSSSISQCSSSPRPQLTSSSNSSPANPHLQTSTTQTPIISVAGVGGTITTVTKGSCKTAPLPRLVAKNGTVNLFLDNIDRRQYVRDLFTTMIDIKWRYNLMAAAFGFVFSWIFFACVWYLVLLVHDDLAHENDTNWSPCIVNVNSFSAALLFSIETQSTLGFGSRIISVECPGAIVIFCVQLIFGVVVECLIVGMVFAKLSRPAKRSQTIMFSKYATICLRQGKMCLMFRVGDVRSKSHVIGATIRASLVSQKITEEGEIIPFYHHQLQVKIDESRDSLLLIWPVTIVHPIDESSPFCNLNAEQLGGFKFEIITVLEGTVESTGQSIQVRSSYLPSEVKWGFRFEPIVSTHGFGRYAQTIIDYNKFNRVVEVETPTCSPTDFYAARQQQQPKQTSMSTSSSSTCSRSSSQLGDENLILDSSNH